MIWFSWAFVKAPVTLPCAWVPETLVATEVVTVVTAAVVVVGIDPDAFELGGIAEFVVLGFGLNGSKFKLPIPPA